MRTNQQQWPDEKPQRNAKDAYLCATRYPLPAKSVNAALAILTVRLSRIEQTRELSQVLIGVPLADRDLAGGE